MTFYEFNLLRYDAQLALVHEVGAFQTTRWDDVHQVVLLYQLPAGFFAEVNYNVDRNQITLLFAFEAGSADDRLKDYAMFVKLPDWLPEVD